MEEEQKEAFQARLDRIGTRKQARDAAAPKRRKDSIWRRLAYPGAFVGAFLLGFLTVFVSRYVQYHMVGLPGDAAGSGQDMISLIFAAVIVLSVSAILKARAKEVASASTVGVLAGVFTYHNLVWQWPDLFARLYGPDWVEFVMRQTEPSSLFIFGTTFTFG